MAIDAKMSFMRQVEQGGAETIPQATMQRMMIIISDVLEGFDMRECERWETEEKDDLFDAFMASMKIQGRSEGTMDRYRRMIRIFMEFAKVTTRKVNVYHVRSWLAAEKESITACEMLGRYWFVYGDAGQSREWWEKARDLGSDQAEEALAELERVR